jgi:hypothetical protein
VQANLTRGGCGCLQTRFGEMARVQSDDAPPLDPAPGAAGRGPRLAISPRRPLSPCRDSPYMRTRIILSKVNENFPLSRGRVDESCRHLFTFDRAAPVVQARRRRTARSCSTAPSATSATWAGAGRPPPRESLRNSATVTSHIHDDPPPNKFLELCRALAEP